MKENRFRLDTGKKSLFIVRLVRYWNRLLRAAVDASSLEMLKVRVEGSLSHCI